MRTGALIQIQGSASQVRFTSGAKGLTWLILIYGEPDLKSLHRLWHIYLVKNVMMGLLMAGPKPLLTEFGIHRKLEGCGVTV